MEEFISSSQVLTLGLAGSIAAVIKGYRVPCLEVQSRYSQSGNSERMGIGAKILNNPPAGKSRLDQLISNFQNKREYVTASKVCPQDKSAQNTCRKKKSVRKNKVQSS